MCLSVEMDRPEDVLSRGEHLGFQWRVIHNGHGYRCGYIRVPAGHPWHGLGYDDIEAECHGRLTFASHDRPCANAEAADDGYWLGFDCGHYQDARDWSLPTEPGFRELIKPLEAMYPTAHAGEVIRTTEYVEAECRSLCEQASQRR